MVKVSVIVPVYNRAKVVCHALNSLVRQTFRDFEVIIVDDFSHDFNLLKEVVKEYNGLLKIKIIRHQENLNGAAARNTGIKASSGSYIAFLDSDDIWDKNKLDIYFSRPMKDNIIFYSQVKDGSRVFPSRGIAHEEPVDEYLFVSKGSMQTSSLMMASSLCRKVMFDESLKRFQDYDFVIRAQKKHGARFCYINIPTVEVTALDHGNRISNSVDYLPALAWLRNNRDMFTDRAAGAFAFNRVVNYCSESGGFFYCTKVINEFRCLKYIGDLDFKVVLKFLSFGLLVKFMRSLRRKR